MELLSVVDICIRVFPGIPGRAVSGPEKNSTSIIKGPPRAALYLAFPLLRVRLLVRQYMGSEWKQTLGSRASLCLVFIFLLLLLPIGSSSRAPTFEGAAKFRRFLESLRLVWSLVTPPSPHLRIDGLGLPHKFNFLFDSIVSFDFSFSPWSLVLLSYRFCLNIVNSSHEICDLIILILLNHFLNLAEGLTWVLNGL